MNQHKWVEIPGAGHEVGGYFIRETMWKCARCGCEVASPEKPYRRRVMRKIGVGIDCKAELCRQVLQE